MPITRHSFPADLEEGLNAHFGRTYRELPEEWSAVFDVESSNKAWEEDVLETGFGAAPRKPEGEAVAYDETYQGWRARYIHDTIALAFAITEEAMEDNLYQRQAPKNASALASAMMQTKEISGAGILNNGFDVNFPGGDGKPLFASDHPTMFAGTQSNVLATPADFSEASLEEMLINIMLMKDDRNIPKALQATKLIGAPTQMFEFYRVLGSINRVGTADNDVNAVRAMGLLSPTNIVKMTRLVDPDAWFVRTDCPESLKHIKRMTLKRGTTEDFATGNMLYKARERYKFGWSDWRGCYASPGG